MRYLSGCLFLVLALCFHSGALGQTRSETGRHKVERKKVVSPDDPARAGRSGRSPWRVGVTVGGLRGSRLFDVESLTGNPILWDPPVGVPFNALRFETNLEANMNLELSVGRDFGAWLSAQSSFSYAKMDMSAEALMGQDGVLALYARPDIYMVSVGVRGKLVQNPSHPFLALDILRVSMSGVGGSYELNQGNFGYRLGGGYMQVISPAFKLRGEVRFTWSAFDLGDYLPDTPMQETDAFTIDGDDHLSFFEVLVGIEFSP